jgi:hypothetical protein
VRKRLLPILVLAFGWFASRAALAQPLRTFTVVDAIKFPPKVKQAHERLREALVEALAPKSWFPADISRPIADCGGSLECLSKVAVDTNTSYVLRLSGNRAQDDGYDITLELYTTATSRVQQSGAYCDYCDIQRINEVIGKSVWELLANAMKEEAALKVARQAPPSPPASPPPAVAPTPAIISPQPVVEPARHVWAPWTMIGVGVAVSGYGVWAIHEDGQSTGGPSPGRPSFIQDRYSSKGQGWGCLVGGAGVAVAGAIWVLATPSHNAAISASPNHVALNVRF